MDYIFQKYREMRKKVLKPYGFKFYGNYAYKVINDVCQYVDFQRSVDGCTCIVYFGVRALCYPNKKNHGGTIQLKHFKGDHSWFEYDRNSPKSIDECISEIEYWIKTYLLSFFDESDTCLKAYDMLCDFERNYWKKFGQYTPRSLQERRYMANPQFYTNDGVYLVDYNKFCMALKNGHYDLAVKHLYALRMHTETTMEHKLESFASIGTDAERCNEYRNKMIMKISRYDEMISRISNVDKTYIQDYIETHEKESLRNLGWKK